MKRLATLLICIISLCSAALAQNAMFAKYMDMDDVKYVSIGRSMIKQMIKSGKTQVGNINFNGLGNNVDLQNILIISSTQGEACQQMKQDHQSMLGSDYNNLVTTREGKQHLSAIYFREGQKYNELVMYVVDEEEHIFIVLNGTFKQADIERMFL